MADVDRSGSGILRELFEPYLQGTAGQYCYRVKADEVPEHLTALGQLMYRLVRELEARLWRAASLPDVAAGL